MELTTNLGLKKPSVDDFVNVEVLNFNADKIDAEIEKKLDKSGGTLTGDLTVGAKGDGGSHSIKFAENAEIFAKSLADRPEIRIEAKKVWLGGSKDTAEDAAIIADGSLVAGFLEVLTKVRLMHPMYRNKPEVLQQASWESVSGSYPYCYKLTVEGLERGNYLDITIDKDSMGIAEKAQICPTVEERSGFAFIYAKKKPTGDIRITRKVMV